MAKRKSGQTGQTQDDHVLFTKKDAQRIANVVSWYEGSARSRNPSKLTRASGSGGGPIRIGQFSGAWPNGPGQQGTSNLKRVNLYIQSTTASGPNDWEPEVVDGLPNAVLAINLFSYIPTRSGGDSYMWCAVTPVSDFSMTFQGQNFDQIWLLLAAEC